MADRNAFGATQSDTSVQSTAVTVGTSSATVVDANPGRIEVTVTNDHASNTVYLALGDTAESNKGIRLNAAGGSYTTHAYTGQITAIASATSTGVLVSEV